jgi:hypothetical protein
MASHSIENLGRRDILRMSAVLAGSGAVLLPKQVAAETTLQGTPDQIQYSGRFIRSKSCPTMLT